MKTSEILLKLSHSKITTTIDIKIIRYALDSSSLFTSTFGPSPNRIDATKLSCSLRSSSIERYSHSTEHNGCFFSSFSLHSSIVYLIGSVESSTPSKSYPHSLLAFIQVKVQPSFCIVCLSRLSISHAEDADHLPYPQESDSIVPFSLNIPPIGPTNVLLLSSINALSIERNLRNAPLLLLAILCAAKSMWSCVIFPSSNVKHSKTPQSDQFVGASSILNVSGLNCGLVKRD